MNHKLNIFFKSLSCAALFALAGASTAGAQMSGGAGAPLTYGLLGQNYYGAEFGYTHHVWRAPDIIQRYEFVANNAVSPGLDVGLRFGWETGNSTPRTIRNQRVGIPITLYKYSDWGRPFAEGEAGWMWMKVNGARDSGFAYRLGLGLEYQALPRLVVAPSIRFSEVPRLNNHVWDIGARAGYRFNLEWSGSFAVRVDEHNNIEYSIGLRMHR